MDNEAVIQHTIHWIENHLQEPISADHVAQVAGFSKFHFHRLFQQYVGMSFSTYIWMRRMTSAASLLLHSDERIIDIALSFQYESQESFTRAFKKMYHLPPGRYRKMMKAMTKRKEENSMEEKIKGWFLSGGNPFNYEIGVDRKTVHQGKASGYLKSTTVQDSTEFGTMMQQFKAEKYLGKRIKLSGFIKTKDVETFAGLWMRVDSASEDTLQFDNMSNRPITGTNEWNHYSIVLDIPENSATISFGLSLMGKGNVWIDSLTFMEVDMSVPTTHIELEYTLLDEPINLSFEESL